MCRLAYPRRPQIRWHGASVDRGLSIRQIEGIADVIYERLLTGPGIPLQTRGTARTLLDDVDITALGFRLTDETLQLTRNSAGPISPQIEHTSSDLTSDHTQLPRDDDPLVSDLNSYLCDLNLDALSEDEIEYANIGRNGPALIGASGQDAAEASSATGSDNNQHKIVRRSKTRGRRSSLGVESPTDPFTTERIISITNKIQGFVNVTSELSLQFSMIRRKLAGISREES